MKLKNVVSGFLSSCHLIILSSFLFVSGTGFAEEAKNIGCVYKLSGKVEILKSGENAFQPLKRAIAVHEGDKIKAFKNSYVDIITRDGTLIRVQENSEITLNTLKIQDREKHFIIEAFKGKIMFLVTKLRTIASRFEVRTPSAVCAVRGTDFIVMISSAVTNIGLFDGKLKVISGSAQKELEVDTEASVKAENEITVESRLSGLMEKEKQRYLKVQKYLEKIRKKLQERENYLDEYLARQEKKIKSFEQRQEEKLKKIRTDNEHK